MSTDDTRFAWWSRLRHSGLLLSPVVQIEKYAEPPEEPKWYQPEKLRTAYNRFLASIDRSKDRPQLAQGDILTWVDALLEKRSFDAIPDLAEAYPLSVFPDAVGLKKEGRESLLPYASVVFNAFGPPNALRQEAIERSAPHQAYVAAQCQRENLAPGGFGACIHAQVDEGAITAAEAPLLVRSLLSAGLDTTVNGIAAAVYCLARYPEQFERLRADLSLARNAFEEAVRYESPVQTFFRTTTRAVELSGCTIGEGEKVLMFLGAANRDPRRWTDPERYDITRRTSGHVGYGSGIHMCVGQLVARLEGEVLLTALAKKIRTIAITGAIRRRYNNTLRGLESLPVPLTPA